MDAGDPINKLARTVAEAVVPSVTYEERPGMLAAALQVCRDDRVALRFGGALGSALADQLQHSPAQRPQQLDPSTVFIDAPGEKT